MDGHIYATVTTFIYVFFHYIYILLFILNLYLLYLVHDFLNSKSNMINNICSLKKRERDTICKQSTDILLDITNIAEHHTLFMCIAYHITSFHWCDREADRNVDCFAFPEGDERMAERSGQADLRKGSLGVSPAHAALGCIITHSLSATLPYSVTCCLFSFLPHSPFIFDLLSWWLWVSLYDTEAQCA